MKLAINTASQFRQLFSDYGRGRQFSYDALGLLFDWFEEVDPDYEVDVIGICCDFSEESAEDVIRAYGDSIDFSAVDLGAVTKTQQEIANEVAEVLSEHTSIVGVTNDATIVYQQF